MLCFVYLLLLMTLVQFQETETLSTGRRSGEETSQKKQAAVLQSKDSRNWDILRFKSVIYEAFKAFHTSSLNRS